LVNNIFNKSPSYEAVKLCEAICAILPKDSGSELKEIKWSQLRAIPGTKFTLGKQFSEQFWLRMKRDIDWFCNTFSLPLYEFFCEKPTVNTSTWSLQSIEFIDSILEEQPTKTRGIIINTINRELGHKRKEFGKQKIKMIRLFIKKYRCYLKQYRRYCKGRRTINDNLLLIIL